MRGAYRRGNQDLKWLPPESNALVYWELKSIMLTELSTENIKR
jgi:hypothetical protein